MLALFLLNAFLIRELFRIEYTVHMGSIEAAYISLSRYIAGTWGDLTWFPLWYGGVPFQNAYPPLLHLIVAAVADATNWSAARAHHFVTAAAYCLGPVTLYLMAFRISADRAASLLCALLYSILSLSAFLIPDVASDLGSVLRARRLQALVGYGEGPHVTSMTLLPIAIVCLHLAFERKRPLFYLLGCFSLAGVVLTNWLGAFALAAAAVSYLLARRSSRREWAVALAMAVASYALASPWIPPTTLAAVRTNAQRVGGAFELGAQHLIYLGVALAALAALHTVLIRFRASPIVHFPSLFFLLMGGVTLAAEWFHLDLLPQPRRYHLEMEMALALLLVFGARALLAQRSFLLRAGAALCILLSVVQTINYRRYAKRLIQPIEITRTTEYKLARWFDEHMAGRRVMAPGSSSFWMNAFTDTPQIGGGFDQGIVNFNLPMAIFQIYSGMNAGHSEGQVAVAWLKALGVHAVAIGGKDSGEYYKPFANPAKFEGLLTEIWRDGDDRIYRVPQRSESLARVVLSGQLVTRAPPNGVAVESLMTYLQAIDDPTLPAARWTWHSHRHATAQASLQQGHVFSIQISYHPGWEAKVNGRAAAVGSDAIGQMVVDPQCQGDCRLDLDFTGGKEALAARIASWAVLLCGISWAALDWRRRLR